MIVSMLLRSACALGLLAASVPATSGDPASDRAAPEPVRLEAAPVTPPEATPPPPEPERGGSDYRIGRQDLLDVRVFGLEELDQTVRVSDDGSITLPLLGRLDVAGLTKSELERNIAERLGERYVRDPQVTIFVRDFESKKVAVTGAVKNPGAYPMLGTKTLLEMISLAGGLDGEFGDVIVVFRRAPDGGTRRVPVDLERLVYAADPALNLEIAPGDIVYVPTVQKIRIFVGGAVKNPNLYEIPSNEPVTVLKAITLAGGTTDRAAEKKVQILRTDPDGRRVTFVVNLRAIRRGKAEDPVLEKDDVVLVQEAFF